MKELKESLPFPQNVEAEMQSPWRRRHEAKFVLFERRGGDPWNDAGLVASGIAGVILFVALPALLVVGIVSVALHEGGIEEGIYAEERREP